MAMLLDGAAHQQQEKRFQKYDRIIAIDPGMTGGIAILNDDGQLHNVVDMPIVEFGLGKKRRMPDAYQIHVYLEHFAKAGNVIVVSEWVNAMRKPAKPGEEERTQGVVSTFNFGRGFGVILGAIQISGLPSRFVTPASWKRHFKLNGKDKDSARQLVLANQPDKAQHFTRKKDDGRADATCIGRWYYERSTMDFWKTKEDEQDAEF